VIANRLSSVLAAPVLISGTATAQAAPSIVVGDWSAWIAGSQWDLYLEPSHQYTILHIGASGDTLVLSMGRWSVKEGAFCIEPRGRDALCGTLTIQSATDPLKTEWRFADRHTSFAWTAYRRGYAPWDNAAPARRHDIYVLSDVARPPRFLGCSAPLVLPQGVEGPVPVVARVTVEQDSSVSNIEIVEPTPAAAHHAAREAARGVVASCRIAPGELANGAAVRVRIEFPFTFPKQSMRSEPTMSSATRPPRE